MTPTPWLMVLVGALFRRRRQRTLGLLAVASLFAGQAGCGPEMPMSEATESGTPGPSTGPAMSTGDGPGEVSARMFGKFHYAVTDVGISVSEPPGGSWFFFPWSTLAVERDGWVTVRPKTCEDQHDVQKFSWVHVGDDALQVVPDEYKSNGTFRWKADDVVAVTLTPGPGCDDLHEVIEYLPDSGKSTYTMRHLPGDICTEDDTPGNPEDCNFTFVWCEEGAPPACTADAP
jgi:hypothetical protein